VLTDFFSQVSPDGFMTLIGSFLGAFIAGTFTLIAVKLQIMHNAQKEIQAKKEKIRKIIFEVHTKSATILKSYQDIYLKIKQGENSTNIKNDVNRESERIINDTSILLEGLKLMNYHELDFESFKSCYKTKLIIGALQHELLKILKNKKGTSIIDKEINLNKFDTLLKKLYEEIFTIGEVLKE